MEYMESKMQDLMEAGVAEQAANDERASVVNFLRAGGDTVRGVFYAWDSEMRGYYSSLADMIERGDHLR